MAVNFPEGFTVETLDKSHDRASFSSGVGEVDHWLKRNARQAQDKQISTTTVLLTESREIAGYYTLAIGQITFDELPLDLLRKLPKTMLPVITLAWLGIDRSCQGTGLGTRLLAQALNHCICSGEMIPFIAVILDCLNKDAKKFYQKFDFEEVPGHPMKLILPWKHLKAIAATK